MINEKQILLFDGVCNLCNASVQFVLHRDKDAKFAFAALQSDIAKDLLLDHPEYIKDLHSIVLIKNGTVLDRSTAALHVAKELPAAWPLLYYLFIWWPKAIRDALYELVANRRYRWFGKQDSCSIPDEDYQDRFL